MDKNSYLVFDFLGDVMLANKALDAFYQMGTESMANLVWSPSKEADLILANLETPITGHMQKRENKRYNFKTDAAVLKLFDDRFVLSLANNHILDYGEQGLLETIKLLQEENIRYLGAGKNLVEARRPLVTTVSGVNVGVICAADPRFQAATKTSAGTFPAQPELLKESFAEIRQQADIILVSIHAGTEFLPVPSPKQLQLAELCLEEGAKIVQFHHAHCVSGVTTDERGVVFFGSGNYIFPYNLPGGFHVWNDGAVWHVKLNIPELKIAHVDIQPVVLDKDGLPRNGTKQQEQQILQRIQRYSRRIKHAKHLKWWRLWEMINPSYLWINGFNFADIARRQGVSSMVRIVISGLKSQLR